MALEYNGPPAYGVDAVGQDAYATVIAAPGTERRYSNLIAYCLTNDAILTVDGGTTDSIYVKAGELVTLNNVFINGAVQAKNATGGNNYTGLSITVW